jgi:hypothetical protein
MGVASSTKFIRNNAGLLTETPALTTSDGAADAQRVPALNAQGILDDSIINASAASAANRVVKQTAAGIIDPAVVNARNVSAGAADAGRIVQLDGSGRIDSTMMPTGIGADTASVIASEALAAGDLVNIWNSSGSARVRKADAATSGKEAHGFVTAAVASGASATVHFEGTDGQLASMTPGVQFLSATTPGRTVASAPTAAGQVVQRVGFAISATAMNFQAHDPILLA